MGNSRPTFEDVEGLVLAGGTSRRFGSDKALASVDGIPMIRRVVTAVSQVVSPVRISVRALSNVYVEGIEHVADVFTGSGPLAGIHAGLSVCQTPWLLVVATDYPFVMARDLEILLQQRDDKCSGVLSRDTNGMLQPLCACYNRSILSRLESALQLGRYRVHQFLDGYSAGIRIVDFSEHSSRNINFCEDL